MIEGKESISPMEFHEDRVIDIKMRYLAVLDKK